MTSATPAIPTSEFLIPLDEITISPDRARDLDPAYAEAFALIIAAQGLINAITVRVAPSGGYLLVTGRKRLEAHRLLKWETIRARLSPATTNDEARLEEVMENLAHEDLKALDRCRHLFELKQVYERMHPTTKNGGDRKSPEIRIRNSDSDRDQGEVFGFVRATAEKIGLARSVIHDAVKIWKGLSVASRTRIPGTWVADNQSGLKLLSERTPADQAKALDALFSDPPLAATMPDALTLIDTGSAPTPMEKRMTDVRRSLDALPAPVRQRMTGGAVDGRLSELRESIATLSKFLGGLQDDELDSVIVAHEDRIIASLQRRGRI